MCSPSIKVVHIFHNSHVVDQRCTFPALHTNIRYISTNTAAVLVPPPPAACRVAWVSRSSKGIAAPTSAVDDIAEKFGRPRARSLSRHDLSLPPWAEDEDDEGGEALPTSEPPRLKDRRRTLSMSSVAEDNRGSRPSSQVCFDRLAGAVLSLAVVAVVVVRSLD